jgi:hypothetical protein
LHIASAEGDVGFGAGPIGEDVSAVGAYAPRSERPQPAPKDELRQADVDQE